MPVSSPLRLSLAVVTTVAAIAGMAGTATASDAVTGCPAAVTSNPFELWGDTADYQLAPAGDIEDGVASWSLTGGARAVEGNETFAVTSSSDHRSLRLPGSASATTARMCIAAEHPSFRFFAKRQGGSAAGRLHVEVVYDDAAGNEVAMSAGEVAPSSQWTPSASLPTMVSEISGGDAVDVSFRFEAQGGGVWSIDDVYVDPTRSTR